MGRLDTKKLLVDESGEIHGEVVLVAVPKRQNGFKGWVAMSQEAVEAIATNIKDSEDLRVFLMLVAKLDFDNYIQVPQVDIAKALGMKRSNVSRAIKNLVERQILLKGPKAGRSWTYRLNPAYGWKGSAHNHRAALKKAIEKWGEAAVETDADRRRKLEELGQTRLTD